jgi:circadian clock protein KaiC
MGKTEHDARVGAWLDEAAGDAPPEKLLALFEAAWAGLWRRAESAVGEIVLESIADLVRSEGVEKHPFLAHLALDSASVITKPLAGSADMPGKAELREGLGFVLAEFIAVIGDLTDQILTPGLYEELSRVSPHAAIRHSGAPAKRRAGSIDAAVKTMEATPMAAKENLIPTGITNLDLILSGGLIRGSSVAVVGPPGSGKTILAQQISFNHAAPERPVVYFSTLSEPGAKTLFYLNKFSYFDPGKIDTCIHFVDLGVLLRTKGLDETLALVVERVKKLKPALAVVDSFKVFEDMAASTEELRKFSYQLVINLITRKCTTLFLGEYHGREFERNPLFSIIDGLVMMSQRELSGEQQRFLQVVKMRGLSHSRDEHSFEISPDGIQVFAPRLTIKRSPPMEPSKDGGGLVKTGIVKLDALLGAGIPGGSSLLIAGVAGTGKTVLGLEFIYRGALAGEKGIVFSFEETDARLRAAARGLGFDLGTQIEKGMVKIVFIPQPDIRVEPHLLMMKEEIEAMEARRVVVDSLSVFVHKMKDPQAVRDKVFQLATIVQNAGAVGFFATDIPYGSDQMSRFGVEETVVDGVIVLTSTEEALERQRYIEVYKLRNTAHLKGRHTMTIEEGGVAIFPRYRPMEKDHKVLPPPAKIPPRLLTGIPPLDKLLGNGLLARSMTLVSGSSGIGKTLLGMQFLLEGAAKGEPGLFVTLEEAPEELLANAAALGLPLKQAVDEGRIHFLYLPPTHIRSTQLLALLTDNISEKKVRRLVLDSTTHIVASGMSRDDVRELVYDLAVRFKDLGVTSLFTLESDLMFSTDSSTDTYRGFAPLSDNVIVLRYVPSFNKVLSTVMVVKTRGSSHDIGLYSFTIGRGGIKIGSSLLIGGPTRDVSGPTGDQQAQAVETGRKH